MNGITEDLEQLRARVRSDRRTVTAPLVVFGALIVLHAALNALTALAGAPERHLLLLLYWPLAGAAGLIVLWSYAHRIAEREGVGEGPRSYRPLTFGYFVSLPLLALLFIPAFFVGVFAPLGWPATILFAIAVRQRNQTLRKVAKGLAFAGAVQLLLVLVSTNVGEAAGWAALGLEAAVGLAMVGLALARRTS